MGFEENNANNPYGSSGPNGAPQGGYGNQDGMPQGNYVNVNGVPQQTGGYVNQNGMPQGNYVNVNGVPQGGYVNQNGAPQGGYVNVNGVPQQTGGFNVNDPRQMGGMNPPVPQKLSLRDNIKKIYDEMNLPNKLTCLRMIMVIPFVIFMLAGRAEGIFMVLSLVLFIAASLTDTLDGHIARSRNLITNFGKFMDPLADKLLVTSAMICLVAIGRLEAWICIIIIAREFIISGFRLVASDNGIVIAASWWGKTKTVSQMLMVILLIINFTSGPLFILTVIVKYAALALTIISLCDYIRKNKQVLSMQS